MKHRMYLYTLSAFLTIILPLLLGPTALEAQAVSFTITELSVDSDLNAVASFQGGVIAVGKSGTIGLAYINGERILERPVDVNLLDVSCSGSRCLAVGEKGVAVIIDVSKKTFKPIKLSDEDLKNVRPYDGRFYILASKQIIVYTLEAGISTVFSLEAIDILPAERLYILGKDRIYYLEEGSLRELKAGSYSRLIWLNGILYGLLKNGVVRVSDNEKVIEGSYEKYASCDVLYLSSGSTIYRFDGEKLEVYGILPFKPRSMACRDGEVYAVGEKGWYAKMSRNAVELPYAPSGKYTTVSSDSGTAYIAGDKVLSYRSGLFKIVEAPSMNYIASSTYRDVAALLTQDRIVLVSNAGVNILPYTVSGYTDVWLVGDRILLAGRKGLVEVSINEMSSREVLGGVELYAVNGYGAVGKSMLAVFSSWPAEVVKVNGTMKGLDGIPCGLAAVGDIGLVAYRDGKTSYYKPPGGEKLRSIAVKPDGVYALIGGSDGGLYVWDGYWIQQLPYKAPGEVVDIAWVSDTDALLTAGGRLLLYRSLRHEEPSLNIQPWRKC